MNYSIGLIRFVFAVILVAALQQQAKTQDKPVIRDRHGNTLSVDRDEYTGTARSIYGLVANSKDYGFDYKSLDSSNIDTLGRKLIDDYSYVLGFTSENLSFVEARQWNRQEWTAHFRQTYKGIPVEGSTADIVVFESGAILHLGGRAYPNVSAPTNPLIAPARASQIAREELSAKEATLLRGPDLCILPELHGKSFSYQLAWKLYFDTKEH